MPGPAPYLLVNNNNSRTKFALADTRELLDHRVLPTPGLTAGSIAETLAGWHFDSVVLASVVPRSAALIRGVFDQYDPHPLLQLTHRTHLGFPVDFPEPETIGADRLANAAAVVHLHHAAPAVVVDFGTAVTFDIVDPNNAYIGGVIAPGLDAMTHYLHQRTALFPELDLREPPAAIGKSTETAMLSGAVFGYRGLVREILHAVTAELRGLHPAAPSPTILATGGHAGLIAAGVPDIQTIHPHLTLEGLRLIANLNLSS